ncbi:hypothetical protein [Sphingomonas sp. SUN039]|uniref:hypothetical protein n=1 Tax=Sphingomonas sp. SUN039 TaxID=2937787 RepID=UPI002164EADF|nr:hypothetical protein [Sphingomonas sp. SUN039]UVO54036.1 hypothetical protein M0209_07835 [Sphingomonas sp. SUN039]
MTSLLVDSILVIGAALAVLFVCVGWLGKTPLGKILWILVPIAFAVTDVFLRSTTGRDLKDTLICLALPLSVDCDPVEPGSGKLSFSVATIEPEPKLDWRDGGFFRQQGIYKVQNAKETLFEARQFAPSIYSVSPDGKKIALASSKEIIVLGIVPNMKTKIDFHQPFSYVNIEKIVWTNTNQFHFSVSTGLDAYNINNAYIIYIKGNESFIFGNMKRIPVTDMSVPIRIDLGEWGGIKNVSALE